MTMQPLFVAGGIHALPLAPSELPELQALFEGNPGYFLETNGFPPRPDEAHREYHDLPPREFDWREAHVIGFRTTTGRLVAMASVVTDLFAPSVWHVGLFVVDAALHGTGMARSLYEGIEAWARSGGARFMRLGVLLGNAKAELFWEKMGFHEVRRREGMPYGERLHTVRVLVKPLAEEGYAAYLAMVARDRPE